MTIPNLITILRFLLVPGVVLALLTGSMGLGASRASWSPASPTASTASSPATSTSARELGAYLDPMADKLLLVSVFVVLGFMGELPLWLVIAAVSRDALIVCAVLLSTVMGHPVAMKPLYVSKANTAVQIVLAALVLAELAFARDFGLAHGSPHSAVRALDRGFRRSLSRGWLRHMNGYGEGPDSSTDDVRPPECGAAAAFRRQIRFWMITAVIARAFCSMSSATSCCPSWPAWCSPISSIRSPTGCSGSACRA